MVAKSVAKSISERSEVFCCVEPGLHFKRMWAHRLCLKTFARFPQVLDASPFMEASFPHPSVCCRKLSFVRRLVLAALAVTSSMAWPCSLGVVEKI